MFSANFSRAPRFTLQLVNLHAHTSQHGRMSAPVPAPVGAEPVAVAAEVAPVALPVAEPQVRVVFRGRLATGRLEQAAVTNAAPAAWGGAAGWRPRSVATTALPWAARRGGGRVAWQPLLFLPPLASRSLSSPSPCPWPCKRPSWCSSSRS